LGSKRDVASIGGLTSCAYDQMQNGKFELRTGKHNGYYMTTSG